MDQQIEAISEIEDSSDHKWVGALADFVFPLRPFERTNLIRFPKVNALAEPIVFLSAAGKRNSPVHDLHSNTAVAPVIANHK
jgi:hypothetical protein